MATPRQTGHLILRRTEAHELNALQVSPKHFLHKVRKFSSLANRLFVERIEINSFVASPHDVEPPNLPHCYVRIVLRKSPIAGTANFHVSGLPIVAVFTTPGFRSIRGRTKQHLVIRVLGKVSASCDFKGNPMAYLEFSCGERFQVYVAPGTGGLYEGLLDSGREGRPSGQSSRTLL